MPVLLFESLRQGTEVETPGDMRAMTLFKHKQFTHRPGKWKCILSLSPLLVTPGETVLQKLPQHPRGKAKSSDCPTLSQCCTL